MTGKLDSGQWAYFKEGGFSWPWLLTAASFGHQSFNKNKNNNNVGLRMNMPQAAGKKGHNKMGGQEFFKEIGRIGREYE